MRSLSKLGIKPEPSALRPDLKATAGLSVGNGGMGSRGCFKAP